MNKKAWLRIVEAVIAIMIIAGVLLIAFSKTVQREDISERVFELQTKILKDIALRDDLREEILKDDSEGKVKNFVREQITSELDFELRICNIDDNCPMTKKILDRDVYAEERIISSSLQIYSPKKVRLFVWEKI